MTFGSGIYAFPQMSGAFIFQRSGYVVVLPSSTSLFMVERGGADVDLHCEQRCSRFLHSGWDVMCNKHHFFVLCSRLWIASRIYHVDISSDVRRMVGDEPQVLEVS